MDTKQLTFNVGDLISVNDEKYQVKGKIVFEDKNDVNFTWNEYFISDSSGIDLWLSIDRDDIILWSTSRRYATNSFALVEKGTEVVRSAYGDVDVEKGDVAYYEEYEDHSSYTCYCEESWDDETEYSVGQRIKNNKIKLINKTNEVVTEKSNSKSTPFIIIGVVLLFLYLTVGRNGCSKPSENFPSVSDVLKVDKSNYSYKTSITGQRNLYATIYTTMFNTVSTTKNIIEKIEGDVETIQENPQDSSMVAILTPNEMCLVYQSVADSSTLVHIASREWTIMNFDQPLYQADSLTEDFYRSFYDYNAFSADSAEYSDDDLNTNYQSSGHRSNYDSHYHTHISGYYLYANSVRQSAIQRRGSSGGG